jgi:hypothetical protein
MRTDGRTDTTKLIVAFRNFAKAPNNTLQRCSYNWLASSPFLTLIFCWLPWIPNILSYLVVFLRSSNNLLIYFDQNATVYTSQYFVHMLRFVASLFWSESKKLLLQQNFITTSFFSPTLQRHGFGHVNCVSLLNWINRMKVLPNRLLRTNVKWPQWAGVTFCWSQIYNVMAVAMSECAWSLLQSIATRHM